MRSSPSVGIYYFLAHSLTTPEPFVRFDLFKDRNFASACIFMGVMALVLFSTMALVSPFLQQVSGHPVLSAGMILSSRGVGTFISMMAIRWIMQYVEARTTMMIGLGITALHALPDGRLHQRHLGDARFSSSACCRALPSAWCSSRSTRWRS